MAEVEYSQSSLLYKESGTALIKVFDGSEWDSFSVHNCTWQISRGLSYGCPLR